MTHHDTRPYFGQLRLFRPTFFIVVGLRGQSWFPSTFKATVHPKRKTLIPPTRTPIKNALVLFALPALLRLLRGAVRLHPFLLSQLERAADHSAKARAERGVSRAEMHPVLYPILLLLARLKAGGGGNGIEGEQTEVTGRGMLLVTWFDICFWMRENRRWLVCSLCRVKQWFLGSKEIHRCPGVCFVIVEVM